MSAGQAGGRASAASSWRPGEARTSTVLARAAWSRIAEPADRAAGALLRTVGPVDALGWLQSAGTGDDAVRHAVSRLCEVIGVDDRTTVRRLAAAVARWAPRVATTDPARDLDNLARLGGRLVVPEDDEWPTGLLDLGDEGPACLWVRGTGRVDETLRRTVSVVGARASTDYGDRVAGELSVGLVAAGCTTVSGGAYGIDAVVHRSTLAVDGTTVAFLAGGPDRLYPAGNADLLRGVLDGAGLVLSELPPGSVPSRVRFLRRNRLIAASGRSTVVVEAAWRSGSLVTARLAAGIGRPVGAVPGPVTAAGSAGCHRLLREGVAVCVTDVDEVLELSGAAGEGLDGIAATGALRDDADTRETDGLDAPGKAAYDALPLRRPVPVDALVRSSGLAPHELMAALGVLEVRGLAVRSTGGWSRAASTGWS
ncbi:DNA-processing protein DprA [Sanguibacter keddieii]|uniref:DNA-processing protein DprA n=1 Tax=Sanguibacter keddieii TaxID=60920 RepID=UPI001FDFE896|nr:DNA-protecting protein DprA [Sanguibacter keddieii]